MARALAAINCIGAIAYTTFPVLAWQTHTPIGMLFATAWICGCASHAFVYFSSYRLLLISVNAPLVVCALIAPFAIGGMTLISLAASATLICMIAAAGVSAAIESSCSASSRNTPRRARWLSKPMPQSHNFWRQ